MGIEYLFDPIEVGAALQNRYPLLSTKVQKLVSQAKTSLAFPGARKSDRQIFRLLSQEYFPNLRQLLDALEACLHSGWAHPVLLSTRSGSQFHSELSTLLVAHGLITSGFHVCDFDSGKGDEPVPDILAKRGELSVVFEVYCPRVWEGMENFHDELSQAISNLDLPLDYDYRIDFKTKKIVVNGRIAVFDPWDFSQRTESASGWGALIDRTVHLLASELKKIESQQNSLKVLCPIGDSIVTVELTNIIKNTSDLPARAGVMISSLSGYAPEGIFERVVRSGVVSKLKRFIAKPTPLGARRILFVDGSRIQCDREFSHPWYQKQFVASLEKHISPRLAAQNTAVVIGLVPALPANMQIVFVISGDGASEEETKEVFGRQHKFSKLGDHLLCCAAEEKEDADQFELDS